MAELLQEIETRRAKRAFSQGQIPEALTQRLLTAATYAPSCFNNQPWRFLVVNREQELKAVKENLPATNYWVRESPLIILVLTEPELDCRLDDRRDYALFDAGLATANLVLQATKEGLIAHPIAGFKPLPIKQALGVPPELILITLVVIGYPGEESFLNEKHLALEHSERSRKPREEVIKFNRW